MPRACRTRENIVNTGLGLVAGGAVLHAAVQVTRAVTPGNPLKIPFCVASAGLSGIVAVGAATLLAARLNRQGVNDRIAAALHPGRTP